MRSIFYFFLLIFLFVACASHKNQSNTPTLTDSEFVLFSMGSYWSFRYPKNQFHADDILKIRNFFESQLNEYESVFSDWIEDSELRKHERRGLTQTISPSPLFLEGLRWSEKACLKSQGLFDITIGAVIWKVREKSIGCHKMVLSSTHFHFSEDPQRLSFGGLVKGALVASLAATIRLELNKHEFMINAGNGNLFLSKIYAKKYFQTNTDLLISNSHSHQNGSQHIFDPKMNPSKISTLNPTKFKRGFQVICQVSKRPLHTWREIGAFADAFSTSLVLSPDLDFHLDGCSVKITQ